MDLLGGSRDQKRDNALEWAKKRREERERKYAGGSSGEGTSSSSTNQGGSSWKFWEKEKKYVRKYPRTVKKKERTGLMAWIKGPQGNFYSLLILYDILPNELTLFSKEEEIDLENDEGSRSSTASSSSSDSSYGYEPSTMDKLRWKLVDMRRNASPTSNPRVCCCCSTVCCIIVLVVIVVIIILWVVLSIAWKNKGLIALAG